MALERKVIIACDTSGNVAVKADGFTDNSCAAATKVFENLYTAKKRTDEQGPEYGIPAPATQSKVGQRF